jgi:putative flippase GtrA
MSERLKFMIFSAIGVFNTLFDIALFAILRNNGLSIVTANLIAVSAALVGSYLLNSRFTFKDTTWTTKRFVSFVAVTVFGLWVLQTAVIYLLQPVFDAVPQDLWNVLGSLEHTARIVVPKLAATVVTFAWNYLWYNKVIFKSDSTAAATIPLTVELY